MNWLDVLLTQTAPVLPAPGLLQWGRVAGWAVVLAFAGVVMVRRKSMKVRVGAALALAVWACVPGEWSPTFWLGLAFQSPSLLGCFLCLFGAVHVFQTRLGAGEVLQLLGPGLPGAGLADERAAHERSPHPSLGEAASVDARFLSSLAWAGVVLGYLLLLDTLALLPVQIYAWGFGSLGLLAALAVALLPWVAGVRGWLVWAAPLSLLLFALTRLPTGNAWDALLDPITWVGLQLWLVIRARAR